MVERRTECFMVVMKYTVYLVIFTSVGVYSASLSKNNVCTNYPAYKNLLYDRNCHYNPDVDSTPYQIAKRYGYKLEDHLVSTRDGYMLTVYRVSKVGDDLIHRQPAILQHGISVDGLTWMISGSESLAFTLVANGYDLWVPNGRGTKFSDKHVNSTISEQDYWNFSFHELATIDLPAIIEYVSESTKRKDLIYIGHSMGSTTALVYSTLDEDHARKYIRGIICLAPVAYLRNLRGLLKLVAPFHRLIKESLDSLGIYAIGQNSRLLNLQLLLQATCSRYPLILFCQLVNVMTTGLAVEQIRPEILPVIFKSFPSATSVKILYHYLQIYLGGGKFQWYDYGYSENRRLYNSTEPPAYDMENISVPVHIFSGKKDFLSAIEDSEYLYERLKCPKGLHVYDLAHNDYAFGKKVKKLYGDILDVMKFNFVSDTEIT